MCIRDSLKSVAPGVMHGAFRCAAQEIRRTQFDVLDIDKCELHWASHHKVPSPLMSLGPFDPFTHESITLGGMREAALCSGVTLVPSLRSKQDSHCRRLKYLRSESHKQGSSNLMEVLHGSGMPCLRVHAAVVSLGDTLLDDANIISGAHSSHGFVGYSGAVMNSDESIISEVEIGRHLFGVFLALTKKI